MLPVEPSWSRPVNQYPCKLEGESRSPLSVIGQIVEHGLPCKLMAFVNSGNFSGPLQLGHSIGAAEFDFCKRTLTIPVDESSARALIKACMLLCSKDACYKGIHCQLSICPLEANALTWNVNGVLRLAGGDDYEKQCEVAMEQGRFVPVKCDRFKRKIELEM